MIEIGNNFITDVIDKDLAENESLKIQTRFPPEPNGYLHIGSVKAIFINCFTAKKYDGLFNLRYDDTNPEKEDVEYVDSIREDLIWLGANPTGGIYFGSDYFEKCYEYAIKLIKDGKAFVCDLTAEEMREYRGTLTQVGKDSPYKNRTIEENLKLFEGMKNGDFDEGSRTLRAKIDMSSPNITMRDPVIYRISKVHHHRQGDKWCIYPMYDFAHPIQDAIEKVTHSLCSLEFENNRPLYDWVIDNIGIPEAEKPHQYEFARLNITKTVMSKRYLRELVFTNTVDGWDDPRMPTICGLRRRGYTPESLFTFVSNAGVSKSNSVADSAMLEACIRDELNQTATRRIAVLDPLKVTITNYPDDKCEYFPISNNPNDPESGKRDVPFSNVLYVEREDFAKIPPPKFFRLKQDGEVRLMGSYIIKLNEIIEDENGEVIELKCTIDPETGGKNPPDGRKIKGTIHWISAKHSIDSTVHLYNDLFTKDTFTDLEEGDSFLNYINPDSFAELKGCKLEADLADSKAGDRYQFVRNGYFCKDSKFENTFNRIVSLKSSQVATKKN